MKITLHIDRLSVKGLPLTASQSGLLQAAVVQELTRLVEAGHSDLYQQNQAAISAQAPRIRLEQGWSPATIGRQIAQSVYQGLPSSNRQQSRTAHAKKLGAK